MKNKNFFYFFSLLIISVFIIGCSSVKKPSIKFENLLYDFGEVEQGKSINYKFTFINSGNDLLKILEVKPTCGCTVTGDYTKETVPGERGYIPVIFNTQNFKGNVQKKIKVTTNIQDSEPITLTIAGTIKVLVEISPRNIHLGQTTKDGPPLKGGTLIKNHTETPFDILEATPSGERISVTLNTIKEGYEYSIDIVVSPPFEINHVRETLTIKTNFEKMKVISIPYQYYGTTDIEVMPKQIIFLEENITEGFTKILSVISHTGTLISIENPQLHGDNMSFVIEEFNPGKGFQIIITFDKEFTFPEDNSNHFSFELKTDSGTKTYVIPIKDGTRE